MNQKLLNKLVESALSVLVCREMEKDGSDANDFFCADVVSDRKFAQNFGGYPRSEIAEINEAASLEMQKLLLQNLQDFRHAADGQNAGRSDAVIALGHRSKYCQMPSEMVAWTEEQIKISSDLRAAEMERINALRNAKQGNINFKPADEPETKD